MRVSREQLLEVFASLDTDELMARHASGNLTELAYEVAEEEMRRRGINLRPTPEQYQAFCDHVCEAHSWYKHLPLLNGGHFVVFVAADAGIGCLVGVPAGVAGPDSAPVYKLVTPPEGREFTDKHPRIHHTWQTTEEYRRRFGYLDYMFRRGPDKPYARDAGPLVRLPEQVEERCGFVLYPYASQNFGDVITWRKHKEAIDQLRAGAAHPARDELLELARLATALKTAWAALGDPVTERLLAPGNLAPGNDDAKARSLEAPVEWRSYLDLEERVRAASEPLRAQEAEKVRAALAQLDDWLQHRW